MNESTWQKLHAAGIEYRDGLKRMNGSEALYIKLLKKFVGDSNYAGFMANMEAGDGVQAAMHLHALKGLVANLSMTQLHAECVAAEASLRSGETVKNMDRLCESYDSVVKAISRIDA